MRINHITNLVLLESVTNDEPVGFRLTPAHSRLEKVWVQARRGLTLNRFEKEPLEQITNEEEQLVPSHDFACKGKTEENFGPVLEFW